MISIQPHKLLGFDVAKGPCFRSKLINWIQRWVMRVRAWVLLPKLCRFDLLPGHWKSLDVGSGMKRECGTNSGIFARDEFVVNYLKRLGVGDKYLKALFWSKEINWESPWKANPRRVSRECQYLTLWVKRFAEDAKREIWNRRLK